MPIRRRGDILSTAKDEQFGLALIFGHVGYNDMRECWTKFCQQIAKFADVRDPFEPNEFCGEPQQYQDGQWMQFVETFEGAGITDSEIQESIERALIWAHAKGIKKIITNGAGDVGKIPNKVHNRELAAHRTEFLVKIFTRSEERLGLSVTLMSLNDVFMRM